MGNIFISYSHRDSKYVRKLENALKQEGFTVWVDGRIDYGADWPIEIQRHLDECEAFIVIESNNSFKSRWVQNEVSRAQRINKPIFPLLLSGDRWLSLESTQEVNVKKGKLPPQEFYGRLSHIATRKQLDSVSSVRHISISPKVKQGIIFWVKVIALIIIAVLIAIKTSPQISTLIFQRFQKPTLNTYIVNEKTAWVNPLNVMTVNATKEITITIKAEGKYQVTCNRWSIQPKEVEVLNEDGCSMSFYAITYQDTTVTVNVTVDSNNRKETFYFRPKH